jgi:pimeloyl-ACP methyl ester carboxylesterase
MRFDVTDLLGQVTTPTLILHPRQAKMIPVEAAEELAGRMPNAHLVLFEGESHAVYLGEERAREFVEAVEEFVGAPEAR